MRVRQPGQLKLKKDTHLKIGRSLPRSLPLRRRTSHTTVTTARTSVLTTNLDAPIVTQAAVQAYLLPLDVLAKLRVHGIRKKLEGLAILVIPLPVQIPRGDAELGGVRDHRHDLIDLFRGELAGALVHVHIALFQDEVAEPAADTLDLRDSVHHPLASIDVGIADTQDMLKILWLQLQSHR